MRMQFQKVIVCGALLLAGCATNDVSVENGRTTKSIQASFERHKYDIYRVYSEALKQKPDLVGKVVFRLTIDPDGHVTESTVVESTMNDNEVPLALNQLISQMDFGKVKDPRNTTFKYPIDFVPSRTAQ